MASPRPVSLLLAALVIGSAVPVLANHVQTSGGKSLAFDHVAGNEWWVEVKLTGTSAASVTSVEAQDTNGPWVALQKKSWGPYAASFHIEPGNDVRFRAGFADGTSIASCPFTHPGGVEQEAEGLCAGSGSSSSTSTTSHGDPCEAFGTCPAFDATFSGVRGNEWWIQATVKGMGLAKVEATLDGGATYKVLAKQSWGAYAASFRIPQGTTVQLRATDGAGATDLSACYRWIPAKDADATVIACSGGSSGSSSSTTTSSASSTSTTSTSSSTTTTEPPQPVWSSRTVADVPGFNFDLAAGDVDRDGKGEVLVLGDEGLSLVKGTTRTLIDERSWYQGLLADGDGDGRTELYAFGVTLNGQNEELRRLTLANGAIVSDLPVYSSTDFSGPFVLVDLDGDGKREFYVGHLVSPGLPTVERVDYDGTYRPPTARIHLGRMDQFAHNGPMAAGVVGGVATVAAMTVADADEDGRFESHVYAVRHGPDGAGASLVGTFPDGPIGLLVGDVDGDGAPEIVAANETTLFLFRPAVEGWSSTAVAPLPEDISAIDLGDGDGDGEAELYATSFDGHLYAVAPDASGALVAREVAQLVTGDDLVGPFHVEVGNGDLDVGSEVYAMALLLKPDFTVASRVFESSFGVPTPRPTFDATFTGVKGNAWWVQASVAGNEPIAKVEARVDCGSWRPLAKQSYGWSASFHVPSGSKVDFRATSLGGATDLSGGYTWPAASPTAGC